MSTQPLEQAIATAREVLSKVSSDQLGDPTPCESWDVSGLINHMIGAHNFFSAVINDQPPSQDATDFAAGDYVAAFDAATSGTVAALSAEGAMGKIIKAPFGDMPGAAFMGLALTDTFQHAWDLAKATGQSTDLAPAMAEMLLKQSQASISDSFRGPDGKAPFGEAQECGDGATNADKLAAFLGRKVA